jgi:hypothetical protein
MRGVKVSQISKLKERLRSNPRDFTFQELETLLAHLDYHRIAGGKTGGSRVAFTNADNSDYIRLHKPHPRNILKPYQVTNLINDLKQRGLL